MGGDDGSDQQCQGCTSLDAGRGNSVGMGLPVQAKDSAMEGVSGIVSAGLIAVMYLSVSVESSAKVC